MKIIDNKISLDELKKLAEEYFGDFVKVVVDIENEIMAVGAELHADEESLLLNDGSKQENLWGFNIYIHKNKDERIQYTSLINIRPKQGNLQIEVKDQALRGQMKTIIDSLVD